MIDAYEKFFISYKKLFNYGSTKENLPNKLLKKLNLNLDIKINKLW